jgi:retron-type reverse transcriptase
MDVLSVEEQEDGSAIVTLDMTELENNMLVEYAVVDILRKQIERIDNEHGSKWNDGTPKEDFCTHVDKCIIDQNLDSNLCIYCKWRVELDVRLLLDIANHKRNGK